MNKENVFSYQYTIQLAFFFYMIETYTAPHDVSNQLQESNLQLCCINYDTMHTVEQLLLIVIEELTGLFAPYLCIFIA